MRIEVSFPGGKRVAAAVGDFVVPTDQPVDAGGDDSAPAPYELFLASLATCAGLYALAFCQARGIGVEGLRVVQQSEVDPVTKLASRVKLEIGLPAGFPDKYRNAIVNAVAGCKVKKTIAAGIAVDVGLATEAPVGGSPR
jgi:ribosomal protein S12 methylthiotransferase accessory factor